MHGIEHEMLAEHILNLNPITHTQVRPAAPKAPLGLRHDALTGSLILDGNGVIRFSSHALANLVGIPADEITGRNVKSILPEMPLSPTTPGYNVAFAAFSCGAGYLHKWVLVRGDGSQLEVEASISSLKTGSEYLFCLGLHCPSLPSMELNEFHELAPLLPAVAAQKPNTAKLSKVRSSKSRGHVALAGSHLGIRSESKLS